MPEIEPYDVVVVTHDHAATLNACLRAVSALSPPPAAVAVVDNASADGSADRARGFADQLPLTVIREAANTGFSAAVNRALEHSSAKWVLLLNPDCAPRPDFVTTLLEAARRRPEVDAIGSITGRLLRATGTDLTPNPVLDAAGMVVTPSGRHFDRGAGEPDDGRYARPAWVFGGTAAATLYRRAALDDVAFGDGQVLAETFFAYREDAELAWRLQWRGWRCLYTPTALAAHSRGLRPERGRAGQRLINRHSVKNRFLLRFHCADRGWHLGCAPWWLLRDLLVIAACLTVEWSSLPALIETWRLRHDAGIRRRWVLDRATVPPPQVRRWFRRGGLVEELSDCDGGRDRAGAGSRRQS